MSIPSIPRFSQHSETHASERASQPGFRMWGQPRSGGARSYGLGARATQQSSNPRSASMSQQLKALFAGCRFPKVAEAGAALIQEQEAYERQAASQARYASGEPAASSSGQLPPLRAQSVKPLSVAKNGSQVTAVQSAPFQPSSIATAEEIATNLDVLKKSVAEGKAATIDREFIKIFSNDIQALARAQGSSEERIAELRNSLSEVDVELNRAQVKPKRESQVSASKVSASQSSEDSRPLIERRTSLKKFAERFDSSSPERKGFELLDEDYRMHHVRGDGQCLFRSFGFSYVNSFLAMTPALQKLEIARLDKAIAALKTPALATKYAAFKAVLQQAAKKPNTTAESVIAHHAASDAIVAFLRAASSAYNEHNGNDTFNAEMQRKGIAPRQYLDDMADMSKAKNGGHLELNALSKLFSANIRIFDPAQIGQDGEVRKDSTIRYQDHQGQDEHFLIYRKAPSNHFDVAIPTPKIEVVGENPDVD